MNKENYTTKKYFSYQSCRLSVTESNKLLVIGWFQGNELDKDFTIKIGENKKEYTYTIKDWKMHALTDKNNRRIEKYYYFEVLLTKEDFNKKYIILTNKNSDYKYQIKIKNIIANSNDVIEAIDEVRCIDDRCRISGWYINNDDILVKIYNNGRETETEYIEDKREEIELLFPEAGDMLVSFHIFFSRKEKEKIDICFVGKSKKKKHRLITASDLQGKIQKFFIDTINSMKSYYEQFGFRATLKKIYNKIRGREVGMEYPLWMRLHDPKKSELEAQRHTRFEKEPLFSILIPLYKTPKRLLKKLVNSIINQTYSNFEICFSEGTGYKTKAIDYLEKISKRDSRIKYIISNGPLKISDNTNNARKIATGEYIVFADHDDMLSPNALFEMTKAINEENYPDLLYSDEDKISSSGRRRFEPHFKPDFSIDFLRSNNYICHLCVVKTRLFDDVKGLRGEYDGSQDYDFVLRCIEKTDRVVHIPKVLYHWRITNKSTALDINTKTYAIDAGMKAVEDHLKRLGIRGSVEVADSRFPSRYRVKYELTSRPKISVIIPNKDHTEDLDRCIKSLDESDYENMEYVIVENNSVEKKTEEYYKKIEKNPRVKILRLEINGFNYSKICNYGINNSDGEILLLLNNDTKLINKDAISEMVSFVQRKEIGAVGARLLYPNGTVQHAGVIIGLGGVASHPFIHHSAEDPGYFCRAILPCNLNCVTAACLMMRREVFEEVGEFDENLAVAFNDVDYCLRIREKGYLIVYNPFARLTHFESLSRGEDVKDLDKIDRFMMEIRMFQDKWYNKLKGGDEYYNPNLTLDKTDFSYR